MFRAQEQKPLNRTVAIKFIQEGNRAEEILERFNQERDILAKFSNHHIVTIHNCQITSLKYGRQPYIVMEYIDGTTITDFADKEKLSFNDRLSLFLDVCDAIEHAHKHGIIHRDIKPGNVLVTDKSGNKPLVKVIDFGIAKAVNKDLTGEFATQSNHVLGTIAYMSPEQALGDPNQIDNRSDNYSLGALLYELLVGKQTLVLEGDCEERLKIIRTQSPLPPSQRINEKNDDSYLLIAKKRGLDPAQLEKKLKGTLDDIVMKCLKKAPSERYQSVEQLVASIQKYIDDLKAPTPPQPQPQPPSKPPNHKYILIYSMFVILVACGTFTAIYYYHHFQGNQNVSVEPPPALPSLDDTAATVLLTNLVYPEKYGKDWKYIKNHTTWPIGYQVLNWLSAQTWFKDKGIGTIVSNLDGGDTKNLVIEYQSLTGTQQYAITFYKQKGVLKFHDIHIYQIDNEKYNIDLSARFINRAQFESNYFALNPAVSEFVTSKLGINTLQG